MSDVADYMLYDVLVYYVIYIRFSMSVLFCFGIWLLYRRSLLLRALCYLMFYYMTVVFMGSEFRVPGIGLFGLRVLGFYVFCYVEDN